MKIPKPVIAHYNQSFFVRSETFIYNYISNIKRFHPICLARKIDNLEQFPFPKEDLYSISFKRYSVKWFLYGGLREYSGRDLFVEKIIKKRNAKLIHAHFGPQGVYALKIKKSLKIPLITTFYGYDISKFAQMNNWKSRYRDLFELGDLFLVEGPFMKSKLVDLGCSEKKIMIQRIGIPLERINFRPCKPKNLNENVILVFSGRFEEKKGLLYVLKAIKGIRRRYKNFKFHIIGDGVLQPQIENFIQSHHMSNYVHMLGFLDYEEYLKEMSKGDIFIHPSITASNGDSEGGAPTTILEAQAMGMPVVSTYHADIPNIVVPGKSALLSEEKNYKQLSEHLAYLLENQDIWEQMGCVGREFVESNHDVNKEVKALEGKYDFLLKKSLR